jgi:N-glycosidase YbiA
MTIDRFSGEYRFLSNFWPCEIKYEGKTYPSTEHAYQAAKTLDIKERNKIRDAKTPGDAKRLGRKITLRSDWESVKLQVMENLVRQKFFDNPKLGKKLIDTGEQELIEGNTWGDKVWGQVNGVGQNHLGKILMKVRQSLIEFSQNLPYYCGVQPQPHK